jgi:hypothetical protein
VAALFASTPALPVREGPRKPDPTLSGIRIPLILKVLTRRNYPGGAFCGKSPQNAPPNLDPHTQPNENKHLKTSLL